MRFFFLHGEYSVHTYVGPATNDPTLSALAEPTF